MGGTSDGDFTMVVERHDDGVAVVRVAGELDMATRPQLESFALEVLARLPERLDVDLGRLVFVDSSGIAALVGVQRAAKAASVPFSLVNVSPPVRRAIEIVHLSDLLLG